MRDHSEASIPELLRGILGDLRELMREEVALARAEIRDELRKLMMAGASLAAGAATLALGGIFLLVALARGLAVLLDWPLWAGFGAVGLVLAAGGGILVMTGRRQMQQVRPAPARTIETVKENIEWIGRKRSSGA
jgi:hypothetical protein